MRLYLFSDFEKSFKKYSRKFVKESGDKNAAIAVLMQGDEGYVKYLKQYEYVLQKSNAKDIFPIVPQADGTFSNHSLMLLESATGILVCGGNMFRYIQLYSKGELADLIKAKYSSGTPYAGISAGAIITTHLGFLEDFSIKPHFSTLHRFNELLAKMKKSGSKYGLGIDDGIRVEIINNRIWKITGNGSLYLFTNNEDNYCFKLYNDGDSFQLEG